MAKSSDKPKKSINFQADLPEIKDLRPRSRFEGSFISEEIEEFDEYQLEYDDFARLADLQLETVDKINLLKRSIKGRRFGASISVDEQTYWILDLSLRVQSINPTSSKRDNRSISGLVSSIVKDSFKRPLIEERGPVITSAPILAQFTICIECRIDAARICVLKAKLS